MNRKLGLSLSSTLAAVALLAAASGCPTSASADSRLLTPDS